MTEQTREVAGEFGALQIGTFHKVPAVKVSKWYGCRGWIPVIGPKHNDVEILNFPQQHFHVDWRFVGSRIWKSRTRYSIDVSGVHAFVVCHPDTYDVPVITAGPELRRMQVKREMPDFPDARARRGWLPHLEEAFACKKLKNGTCPHRGLPLSSLQVVNGIVRCPGHGLRWNVETGELVKGAPL